MTYFKLFGQLCFVQILLLVSGDQEPVTATKPGVSLYEQAVALRDKEDATFKEQKDAATLLARASQLRIVKPDVYGLPGLQSEAPHHGSALDVFDDVFVGDDTYPPALRELARAYQEGVGVEPHQQLALQLYRKAAELGDPEAQGHMGVRFAFGLQHPHSVSKTSVLQFGETDEPQALLHYYFAAASGDAFARMALGYRHLHGLGVPKNCWTAAAYYQPVAEQVTQLATAPGRLPQLERIRLNVQATQGLRSDRQKEVLQFYQYSADRGNVDAQTTVGQVLNYGIHGIQRDHAQALHYFRRAAEAGDVEAMAHLGHMHANGLGTTQSDLEAFEWLDKAAARKNVNGLFGLGYMHLVGQGTKEDHDKAFKFLSQAAEMGHPDAYFFLGVMHLKGLGLKRRNVRQALQCFTLAAHAGNLLAMYNAAMLHMGGKGTPRACKPAVALLKQVAERGPAAVALQVGHEHFFKAQYTQALLSYLRAAEMGLELGQSNAAWMLERGVGHSGPTVAAAAFHLHCRSAEQGNVPSLLAMGDAFFYGKGVSQDWIRASAIYYEAYQERSAEAMFNLGYMHEFGAGVPKDLQLAKRFYRMAKHVQPDGAAGVLVACAWLRMHELWEALRPFLPKRLDYIWSRVFVLQPPATSPLGLGFDAVLSALAPQQLALHWEVLARRLGRMPGIESLQLEMDEVLDLGETATMLVLLLGLAYVLNLRRRRAAQAPGAAQPGAFNPLGPDAAHGAAPLTGDAWMAALRANAQQQQPGEPFPPWPSPTDAAAGAADADAPLPPAWVQQAAEYEAQQAAQAVQQAAEYEAQQAAQAVQQAAEYEAQQAAQAVQQATEYEAQQAAQHAQQGAVPPQQPEAGGQAAAAGSPDSRPQAEEQPPQAALDESGAEARGAAPAAAAQNGEAGAVAGDSREQPGAAGQEGGSGST